MMCFSATQPPKIHFSMKGNEGYSPEKIDITPTGQIIYLGGVLGNQILGER